MNVSKLVNKVVAPAVSSALALGVLSGATMAYAASNTTSSQYEITLNGVEISKPTGIVQNGTTYMPIYYVEAALNKLGLQNSWDGTTWNITPLTGTTPNLSNIPSTTGPYQIDINNTIVFNVQGFAAIDPSTQQATTFMPIWYIQQVLLRLGIEGNWNGKVWAITSPGVAPSVVNTVLNGTGSPVSTLGVNGDFYIDTAADLLYGPKTPTGWGTPVSLIGSRGSQGATGATGPQGPAGPVHQVVGVINPDASQQTVTSSYTATVTGTGPYQYTIIFPASEFTYRPLPMVLALGEVVTGSLTGQSKNGNWFITFTVASKTVISFIATQITQ